MIFRSLRFWQAPRTPFQARTLTKRVALRLRFVEANLRDAERAPFSNDTMPRWPREQVDYERSIF
jgi:hypothetical protein